MDVFLGGMSARQIAHVLGALEMAERPAPARMDHAYHGLARYARHDVRMMPLKVHSRSRSLERLKVCCFCKRKVSLTRGRPPTVLLCALLCS